MHGLLTVLTMGALVAAGAEPAKELFAVDAQIPAGNVVVEKIEGDTVRVRPDLRDTQGDWFYWAFRVKGAAGRTLTFNFGGAYGGAVVGTRGPVVSTDKGGSWSYACEKSFTQKAFVYSFAKDADEVWFYECHPYLQSDWEAFLARHATDRGTSFKTDVLCRTKKGRDVERALFGCLGRKPKYTMLLTSRHHASESVATYALEGFLEAVLAKDALLEKLQCGSLNYKASDDLPYGQAWNTGGNYAKGWSAINWALNKLPEIKLAHTFEIPFATANGATVTPDKVRDFGRDLAKTLKAFLEEN